MATRAAGRSEQVRISMEDGAHFTTQVTLTAYEDDAVVVKRCWSRQAARRFG